MFDKVKNKSNELRKVRDELHELVVKRGGMLGLSHQDPTWSEAKVHNWTNDIDKLQAKELEVLQELADIKSSKDFQTEMDKHELLLDVKRKKLQADLKLAEDKQDIDRYEMAARVLESEDPFKLMADMKVGKERIDLLRGSLDAISQAYRVLVTIGEPVLVPAKTETINQHETPVPVGPAEVPQLR